MPKFNCYRKECTRIRSDFSLFLNRRQPPRYDGNTFCSESCMLTFFEKELSDKWRRQQYEKNRKIPRPKLGTILMQTAFITREQLEEAVTLQARAQEGRLGEWLLRLGYVEEHQITAALARQYGLPLINLKRSEAKSDAVRLIPGMVAKCSRVLPVGFDDDRESLRIAVSAPVNFNSQEAIRRMVRKGIVAYIGDQSAIQQLLEEWYKPEELDMSNVPTFGSLDDLLEVGREMIANAINHRASNIQAELLQDFFWVRLDFASASHHYFFRYISTPLQSRQPVPEGEIAIGYAGTL